MSYWAFFASFHHFPDNHISNFAVAPFQGRTGSKEANEGSFRREIFWVLFGLKNNLFLFRVFNSISFQLFWRRRSVVFLIWTYGQSVPAPFHDKYLTSHHLAIVMCAFTSHTCQNSKLKSLYLKLSSRSFAVMPFVGKYQPAYKSDGLPFTVFDIIIF